MAHDRARYEAALNRGHAYSWDQRWEEAIREFQAAVSEFPGEPAPYAGLGMAYSELSRLDKALENYKLAARHSQGDVIYLKQVAEVQEKVGQLSEAGQTYLAVGEAQLRRHMLDDAISNWMRAVRLERNLLGAHQRLAAIYHKRGQTRAAIREYLAIGRILQDQGQSEKAMQTCQAALQLDPRNPDILTAIELVRQGERLPLEEGESSAPRAAAAAEAPANLRGPRAGEPEWPAAVRDEVVSSPAQDARRMALEQLAEEIFDEGNDAADEALATPRGLSKLERHALISQALDYQTRGQIKEAISCYERAVAGGVNSTAARFNLGLLYQDRLRFEEAIGEFEFAVRDPEYHLGSHFALGECHRARGRIDRAVEHFIDVLKIVDLATVQHGQANQLIELYDNLADSLLTTKGEPEQATAFANALVEFLSHKGWEEKVRDARARLDALSGGRPMILGDMLTAGSEKVLESLYLSQEYARRGLYNSAVEEMYRVIQLSPEYLPAHNQLAELLIKQERLESAADKLVVIGDTFRARGDSKGAIGAYERVVDLSSLNMKIRGRLIELLKQEGDIDRALEHYIGMGTAYYQLAQVDKARETYQEAMKLAPRGSPEKKWRPRLLRLTADIDLQRFDWKRALIAYSELRQEEPGDERAAITLIDLFHKVGQPDSALRELDRYLIQLVKGGRGIKVVGILEDLVSQRPGDAGLVERLARLYVQQKRRQDAINLYDHLAESQLENGDKDKAIVTVEKILQLNPPNAASYQQLIKQVRA